MDALRRRARFTVRATLSGNPIAMAAGFAFSPGMKVAQPGILANVDVSSPPVWRKRLLEAAGRREYSAGG